MTAVLPAPAAARSAGQRRVGVPRPAALGAALVLLALVVLASLAIGARDIAPAEILAALTDPVVGDADHDVVRDQRVPRTLAGLAAGAALGLAGTVMQGLTRNPLADPGLLGVNAGASLAVVLAATLLGVTSPGAYVWFALAGAALAALLVHGIGAAGRDGATPVRLALAGVAVTAGATSVITVLLLLDSDTLSSYRRWSVGSLAGRDLDTLGQLALFLLVGAVLALATGRALNLLAMGDDVARGLGLSTGRARALAGIAVVLLAGSATALAGPVVFVGLVVPHVLRPFTGPDHRWLLPFAAVLGPVLLLAADVLGRLLLKPGELEAGIVVAAVGAPVLVAVVRRSRVSGL